MPSAGCSPFIILMKPVRIRILVMVVTGIAVIKLKLPHRCCAVNWWIWNSGPGLSV